MPERIAVHTPVKPVVYAALFIALISVGSFMAIPVGPVPIALQSLFVLLAGLLLAPSWAVGCVAVYLFMGLAGLPVFAGGTSGIGRLFGPTGGYLLGYLPAVFVTSLMSKGDHNRLINDLGAMIAGTFMIYAIGVPWLKLVLAVSWGKALGLGMIPFLPGDGLKIAAGMFIVLKLRPMIRL